MRYTFAAVSVWTGGTYPERKFNFRIMGEDGRVTEFSATLGEWVRCFGNRPGYYSYGYSSRGFFGEFVY